MIAACCDREAMTTVIAHPLTGQPLEVHDCLGCRRRHALTDMGEKWIRSPHYCADGWCGEPIFRFVVHPRTGLPIPLWPDPAHVIAEFETRGPGGRDLRSAVDRKRRRPHPVTWQHYCSEDCAPVVGEKPRHVLEEGGDPHRYVIGKAIRVTRAATWEFCQTHFTDQRGAFLRAWLADELHLPRPEQERLMRQWEEDRSAKDTHG